MAKSQSWSIDVILAALVFIFAFILFYHIMGGSSEKTVEDLQKEAVIIAKSITSDNSPLTVISKNELNETKLNELMKRNYTELKSELGLVGDFCIYFKDQQGNIILFNQSIYGTGSKIINISDNPCNESISI